MTEKEKKCKKAILRSTQQYIFFVFHSMYCFILLMHHTNDQLLPSTSRYHVCLLPKPGIMHQSLSSEISDVHPAQWTILNHFFNFQRFQGF